MNRPTFSHNLIKEYQQELYEKYGFFVSAEDAQEHLRVLARSMFPTALIASSPESREAVQVQALSRLAPARFQVDSALAVADEVGDSITPTSGQNKKIYG